MTRLDEHRKEVLTHLRYIKEGIDNINGRVRKTENSISWIKGIGTTLTFIIGIIIAWFKFDK